MEIRRVALRRVLDVAVDSDALDLGDVSEHDWFAEETQDIAAARTPEGSVFVVR